ncbi:MAG: hypothetical protein KDJ54_08035 [Candidatus Competibacteraceae bacterium]|nr:hypothetical protein [Candidatus Competibacteraceae bacterium]
MSTFVLFFGGYRATTTDMKVWESSAKAQKSDVEFCAVPWPSGAASDARSAVSTFTKMGLDKSMIAAIQASNADKIYLVGHSSGCAIANAVDHDLKDHAKVVLVALDGFVPNRKQLMRQSTQVWAAECGTVKSKNYRHLKHAVGSRLRIYTATNCKTLWALHFSLVNSAASDKVVKSIRDGYSRCRANLVWL